MLARARERLAELLQSPDGSRRREYAVVALLALLIVGSLGWGIYGTFVRGDVETLAGNYMHYICKECGHQQDVERSQIDRKQRIAMELGGPGPIGCPECGKSGTALPASECPKCHKQYLARTASVSELDTGGVRADARPCPHCAKDAD